jgi:uracil-DNA glycosylase
MENRTRHELEDILRFYAEAGLDYAAAEAPVDQFSAFEQAKGPAPSLPAPITTRAEPRPAPSMPRPAAIPDGAAIAAAQTLARGCGTIAELMSALSDFEGCGLRATAKSLVFADGNAEAPVMFVSDVPGREDDLEGRLFAGPAGLLMDRMLAAISLNRDCAYLGTMIPWRPPGNRAPTAFEIEVCLPFIQRHIELAAPKVLVLLGDLPAKRLTSATESILRLRGQWRSVALPNGPETEALAMLHPGYLMKQPAQKRLAWADLLALKGRLS